MRARKLPTLPKSTPSILGPVPVTRVKDLKDDKGRECSGICNHALRVVRLATNMSETVAWQTYWHEWAHIVMVDAGIEAPKVLKERLCDAFANARVREMLDR